MTDSTAESIVTDVQWIKKLLGWGLPVAGCGLLLLLSVIVYFDRTLHAAILSGQSQVNNAINSGHDDVTKVMSKLQESRTQHALEIVSIKNRQDNFYSLCCGGVSDWITKPRGE